MSEKTTDAQVGVSPATYILIGLVIAGLFYFAVQSPCKEDITFVPGDRDVGSYYKIGKSILPTLGEPKYGTYQEALIACKNRK